MPNGQGYMVVEQTRSSYMKIAFFRNKEGVALQGFVVFSGVPKHKVEGAHN
jgi:hypothetical protein